MFIYGGRGISYESLRILPFAKTLFAGMGWVSLDKMAISAGNFFPGRPEISRPEVAISRREGVEMHAISIG
jgi:hypothetical protein